MPDAQSKVTIVFEGKAQNLEAALKEVQADLARFGAQADKAGAQAGEHLAAGEHKAAHEAAGLGERAKIAAEMVGLLGAESAEQVIRVQGLSHAFGEARHAFGGFGGAIAATAGSFALFKGLDFLHESVDAAMEGEHATAAFNAALGKTPALMEAANKSIEEHRDQLTRLAIDDSDAMAMMAKAAGRGLDPRLITENVDAFADLGVAIGSGFGGAVDAVTHGQRGLSQVMRALNLSAVQQKQLMAQMGRMTPDERVRAVLGLVERSRFAGSAEAQAGTAEGKMAAFHTAMKNLQEEVGTALLPALLKLAEGMTTMLVAAEHAAQPFGGLANVLKTLFVPMLGAGLLLFTNLRGVMTRLVDVLLGRLLGAFSQTAGSMAEADSEARHLADDLRAIPETVTTTAAFVPATAIKDAYKANIYSIPTTWTTTATFVPASVAEPAAVTKAVSVPVVARNELAGAVSKDIAGAQTYATAHPIRVSLVRGVGTGLAVGTAMAITDAIFNSVTIKHVTLPPQKIPEGTPHAATVATTVRVAGTPHVAISGTPNVAVTNIGALGPALVGAGGSGGTARTVTVPATVSLPKTMDVKAHQSGRWEVSLAPDALARFGQMIGEIAVGTALGSIAGNLGLRGLDWLKNILGGLFRARGGKGGGGPGGAAAEEPAPQSEADWVKRVLSDAAKGMPAESAKGTSSKFVLTGVGDLGTSVGTAISNALAHVNWGAAIKNVPLVNLALSVADLIVYALKSLNWKDALRGVGSAAAIALAIAGAVAGFLAGAFKLLTGLLSGGGPLTAPGASGASMYSASSLGKAGYVNPAPSFAQFIGTVIGDGLKMAGSKLKDLGGWIVQQLIDGFKSMAMHAWPSFLPWAFGGDRPKHGALYIGGHNYPEYVRAGTKTPTAPHGYEYVATGKSDYPYRLEQQTKRGAQPIPGDFIGRFGGGGLAPALVTAVRDVISGTPAAAHPAHQLVARVATLHPLTAAHRAATATATATATHHTAAAHQTHQHTYHATFNIHGATDPQAVARQVNHAFGEFVQGARATKRLHG